MRADPSRPGCRSLCTGNPHPWYLPARPSRLSSPVPSLPRRQKQDFPSEGTLSWAHLCRLPADGPPAPLPAQPKRTQAGQPPKVRRGRDLRSSAATPRLTGGASSPGGGGGHGHLLREQRGDETTGPDNVPFCWVTPTFTASRVLS